jgi:hypothetical protein
MNAPKICTIVRRMQIVKTLMKATNANVPKILWMKVPTRKGQEGCADLHWWMNADSKSMIAIRMRIVWICLKGLYPFWEQFNLTLGQFDAVL